MFKKAEKEALKAVFPNEASWCKHYLRLDINGKGCKGNESGVVKRCILGGLQAVVEPYSNRFYELESELNDTPEAESKGNIARWNNADERTFEDIQQFIDRIPTED